MIWRSVEQGADALAGVDSSHGFGKKRRATACFLAHKGIRPEIARRFQVGAFYGQGMLADCIAVRLFDPKGVPLGYAGRRLDPETARTKGKWKFPRGLPRNTLLYGYHHTLHLLHCGVVVLVEGPWGVLRLAQLGIPAVAGCPGTRRLRHGQPHLPRDHPTGFDVGGGQISAGGRAELCAGGRRPRFCRLLDQFVAFWRQHAESFLKRQPYSEAAAQLVCMAYLQRVVNGAGYIDREYAAGSGRIDLCLRWPQPDGDLERFALELKVWRQGQPDPIKDGLDQLSGYLERLGLSEGTLVIFDTRQSALPFAERGSRETLTRDGRDILVLRL